MARDHFVSRFYLEGFTQRDTPQGKKASLWVHLAKVGEWKLLPPNAIGAETDYYTVTARTGERNRQIEKALSRVEGAAAPLIRGKKIASRENLTDKDRASLALFIATMMERVPAAIDNLN